MRRDKRTLVRRALGKLKERPRKPRPSVYSQEVREEAIDMIGDMAFAGYTVLNGRKRVFRLSPAYKVAAQWVSQETGRKTNYTTVQEWFENWILEEEDD